MFSSVKFIFMFLIFLITFWDSNVFAQRWFVKQDMRRLNRDLAGAVANDTIYAIGGLVSSSTYGNWVDAYNPATDTWYGRHSMSVSRANLIAETINGKIYAIGGFNGSFLSTNEEYNPATDTWTTKAAMPTARSALAGAVVGGKLYAIGGRTSSGVVGTVEEYDPVTDTWATKTSMPNPREYASAVAANSKIYVLGGILAGSGMKISSIVEVFDPVTNSWSTAARMPIPRTYLQAEAIRGTKIYAMGGFGGYESTYLNSVDVYTIDSDSWAVDPDIMLTSRSRFASVEWNEKIYAYGGYSGVNLSSNHLFTGPAPTPPKNLIASGGNHFVRLKWQKNPESDLLYYTVYRDTINGFSPTQSDSIGFVLAPDTVFNDFAVFNDTTYYYRIKAVNNLSFYSGFGNQAYATPHDTTPPAAPQNLIAAGGDKFVQLQWTVNTEPDIRYYDIYRSKISGFTPSAGDSIGRVSHPTVTYRDSLVTNDSTYYYKITALDLAGNKSGYSSQTSATPHDTTPPVQPQNLIAVAGDRIVRLRWFKNTEPDLKRYSLYKSTTSNFNPSPSDSIGVILKPDTTFRDSAVVNYTIYYYKLAAWDSNGNKSIFSLQAIAVPHDTTPPSIPQNLIATGSQRKIRLTWTVNPETDMGYYTIYKSVTNGFTPSPADSIGKVLTPATAYVDTPASVGVTYFYRVSATDTALNHGNYSAQSSAASYDSVAPSQPQNFTARGQNRKIILTWWKNPEPDVLKYRIYRSLTDGFTPLLRDTIGIKIHPDSVLIDSTVSFGYTYYYRMSAIDSFNNESQFSGQALATALDTIPPAAPESLKAFRGDRAITLRWHKNKENDVLYYIVYRNFDSTFVPNLSDSVGVRLRPETTYVNTGLINDTTYYYKISAVDSALNKSNFSNLARATPTDTTPPGAPQNLIATAGQRKATLSWLANTEQDLKFYTIYRSVINGFIPSSTDSIGHVGRSGASFVDSLVLLGNIYYYKIAATDSSYQRSQSSNQASASSYDIEPPSIPINLTATGGHRAVTLKWNKNTDQDLYSYMLYRSLTNGFSPTPSDSIKRIIKPETTFVDTSVINNITYYYKLAALDSQNNKSDYSNQAQAIPRDSIPPAIPQNLTAQGGNHIVTLKWYKNTETDLLKYVLYRSTTNGFTPSSSDSIGIILKPDTSYQDATAFNGVTYYYRLAAGDSNKNYSGFSNQATATPFADSIWTRRTNSDSLHGYPAVVEANGKIYVIGGENTRAVEEYNPVTNTWTLKTPIPGTRVRYAAGAINGIIYVVGGRVGAANVTTVEAFDPVANTWTARQSLNNGRSRCAVTDLNGLLYAIGGTGQRTNVERYNPGNNTWTVIDALSQGREDHGAATANGKVYAISGWTGGALTSTVEEFNPSTAVWTTVASIPTARRVFATATVDNQIFTIGGYVTSTIPLSTVQSYNSLTNIWMSVADTMITPRYNVGGITFGPRIFVGGGYNASVNLNKMEVFNPRPDSIRNLKANLSLGTVSLKWNKSVASDLHYYVVYRSTSSGFTPAPSALIGQVNPPDTVFTDENFMPNTRYYYRIAAVDSAGNPGYASKQDSIATPSMTALFTVNDTVVTARDTLIIPMKFKGSFTGLKVVSFQIKVSFDSLVLQGLSFDTTGFGLPVTYTSSVKAGSMQLAAFFNDTLSGSNRQLRLKFVAHPFAGRDTTYLKFTQAMFNEGNPPVDTVGSRVRVLPKLGDVNGNGQVSASDAALILQSVVELVTLNSMQSFIGDVSYNGSVTAYDASLILYKSVGRITKFPAEDSLGLKPGMIKIDPKSITFKEQIDGDMVWYSINSGIVEGLSSLQFVIDFPESEMTFEKILPGEDLSLSMMETSAKDGKVFFAAAQGEAISLQGVIARVGFKLHEKVKSVSNVLLSSLMFNEIQALEGTKKKESEIPDTYTLQQNYPNPFNPVTTIQFQIPQAGIVSLKIYNILGQEVRTLINSHIPEGYHKVLWDGKDARGVPAASGIYIYRIHAGSFIAAKKMIVMK